MMPGLLNTLSSVQLGLCWVYEYCLLLHSLNSLPVEDLKVLEGGDGGGRGIQGYNTWGLQLSDSGEFQRLYMFL